MKKNNFWQNNSQKQNFANSKEKVENNFKSDGNKDFNAEKISDDVNNFANMNEDELLTQMFKIAKQSKESGQLNNSDMDNFFSSASAMLNSQQKTKLKKLLEMLKD